MIEARDDHPHPIGPDPAWSESYYFNFHDPASGLAGFTRIGFRPNEGVADGNLFLFLPEGGAVAVLNRETRADDPADITVGGLVYERLIDLQGWRVRCGGTGLAFERAADLDIGATTVASPAGGRVIDVAIDLSFGAAMPPFGTSGRRQRSDDARAAAASVAAGHFEQLCSVRGSVRAGEAHVRVKGIGLRDRSWGPRDWSAPWGWRWFSIPFGEDLALGVHAVILPGREVQAGWAWRDGALVKVAGFTLDTTYQDRFQRSLVIEASDVEGRTYTIEGDVSSVIPLRVGGTRIAEGLTTFTMDGRTGTGIAEYLDNTPAT